MNINNINVNKYPVSQVFDPDSKVIFEIPKYQREYTWGSREWEALFDDLTENDDGYYGLNYTSFVPFLISYCQSLYKDLSTCKQEIKTLKNSFLKVCEVNK